MNHFNPKTLAFYGTAIGSVVGLFMVVTAYGNANLKAPEKIEGDYPLKAQWPSCLKANSPVLKLTQSGIYLTGSLFEDGTAEVATSSEEKPSLTGQFQGKELSLAGSVPHTSCPEDTKLAINGSVDQLTLRGQLNFNSDQSVEFTAQRKAEVPNEGK